MFRERRLRRYFASGTGTSELPFVSRKEGFKSQVGIDFSKDCIDSLQNTLQEEGGLSSSDIFSIELDSFILENDVTNLTFGSASFDAIVDKGNDCVMSIKRTAMLRDSPTRGCACAPSRGATGRVFAPRAGQAQGMRMHL